MRSVYTTRTITASKEQHDEKRKKYCRENDTFNVGKTVMTLQDVFCHNEKKAEIKKKKILYTYIKDSTSV